VLDHFDRVGRSCGGGFDRGGYRGDLRRRTAGGKPVGVGREDQSGQGGGDEAGGADRDCGSEPLAQAFEITADADVELRRGLGQAREDRVGETLEAGVDRDRAQFIAQRGGGRQLGFASATIRQMALDLAELLRRQFSILEGAEYRGDIIALHDCHFSSPPRP
jgi:hypothetical protein